MADIKIDNISGSDLFIDSENFLQELNGGEIDNIFGGVQLVPEMAWSTMSMSGCGVTGDEWSTFSASCR